jgi:hypothetical protein
MLDRRTKDWLGGICAIATVILFGAGWAAWAGPGLPDMNSAASVANWFVHHKDACRIAAILGSLSLFPMLVFDVCLYGILREAEGGDGIVARAYFGAALVTVVFDLMFLQFLYTVAWRPGQTLPQVTQALDDLFLAPGVAAFACWMLAFGAVALIVLKRGGLPRRLGQAAIVVALTQLLFLPTSFVHGGTFDISNGLLGVFIPLGAPLIWSAATGVVMLKRAVGQTDHGPIAHPMGLTRVGERTVA